MGSSNPLTWSSTPPERSPTPLLAAIECLGRGDEARPWRQHQRRRRRRGHQWPGGRARGGCGGPCGPGAAPWGRTGASWLPCTAVWGASDHRPPRDRVALWRASGRLWGRQGGRGGAYTPLPPPGPPCGRLWGVSNTSRGPGGGSTTATGTPRGPHGGRASPSGGPKTMWWNVLGAPGGLTHLRHGVSARLAPPPAGDVCGRSPPSTAAAPRGDRLSPWGTL